MSLFIAHFQALISAAEEKELGERLAAETASMDARRKEIVNDGKEYKHILQEAYAKVKREENTYQKALKELEEHKKQVAKLKQNPKDKEANKLGDRGRKLAERLEGSKYGYAMVSRQIQDGC